MRLVYPLCPLKYACASYVRVVSKQQLLSNFDNTGPFFNKIVKASTIYLSSLISRYLLHITVALEKSNQWNLLHSARITMRKISFQICTKYPKNERRPQITKLIGHDSSNVKSRFYSKFEFKNSQKNVK